MILKTNLLIALLLLISPCFAQDKNDLDEMINHAIQSVVKRYEEYIMQNRMKQEEFDKYYIVKDRFPGNFILSDENKNLNQKVLYSEEIPFKELKKGVYYFLFSMDILDGDIHIYITKMGYKIKKDNIVWRLKSDGYLFAYRYSCDKQKWELIDSPKWYLKAQL